MSTVNIFEAVWHNTLGHQNAQENETSVVAAAVGAASSAIGALIKSNYKIGSVYQDSNGKSGGTAANVAALTVDSTSVLYHGVLSTGATGACTLYRVTWHNSRMNAANTQSNVMLVLAAANSQAGAFASPIQTANGDGITVTIDSVEVILPGVLA